MTETDRLRVYDTNDDEMRRLIHENLKVFAKFTSENCSICASLSPPFQKFADDPEFAPILFVRLDSDENPVAKKLMQDRIAPFFVSYCQGQLLECDTQTTEADVLAQLHRLRDFMPHTR